MNFVDYKCVMELFSLVYCCCDLVYVCLLGFEDCVVDVYFGCVFGDG